MTLKDLLGNDPLAALATWIDEASKAGFREPNAMALASVAKDGRPSVRIVLAKDVQSEGVQFFTNYESRKATELMAHPDAAATFHWVVMERQVRVEGVVEKVSRAVSEAYFATRARDSQLAAWASPQSQSIHGYDELMTQFDVMKSRFDPGPVPCPPHWGGFILMPRSIEFWQGLPNRLHDRLRFERQDKAWITRQLAP